MLCSPSQECQAGDSRGTWGSKVFPRPVQSYPIFYSALPAPQKSGCGQEIRRVDQAVFQSLGQPSRKWLDALQPRSHLPSPTALRSPPRLKILPAYPMVSMASRKCTKKSLRQLSEGPRFCLSLESMKSVIFNRSLSFSTSQLCHLKHRHTYINLQPAPWLCIT